MKHLVVAEKPSVGRDIARVLQCTERHTGYISGNDFVVTWGIGHLVTSCMPEEIDPRFMEWKKEDLPIIPDPIPLKVIPETEQQYHVVRDWMSNPEIDEIICATDAGREGELIFRYIYQMADCHKPVKRLWISSMTPQAIREGFSELKSAADYDNLYQSARCRADADWLIGINGSRAYSLQHNATLSVGRVQSPTLAILVEREKEIQSFVPEQYQMLYVDYGTFKGEWFTHTGNGEITNRIPEELKSEMSLLKDHLIGGKAVVRESTVECRMIPAPLLYDLTSLQRDANRLYGFTAKRTLSIAQKLYEERKAITYPRTDSRNLSHDMANTLKSRLENLTLPSWQHAIQKAKDSTKNLFGRFINDAGVTDHHAIIPTGYCCSEPNWTEGEQKIFDLVARRFIAMFLSDREVEDQNIITDAMGNSFRSRGQRLVEEGWAEITPEALEELPSLPNHHIGDALCVVGTEMEEKTTTPPPPHTDASLLYAMEHVTDLGADGSSIGLGTPATRADMIEKLIKRKYVKRKGKAIIPTNDGIQLCEMLPQELKTPALTVQWEQMLSQIGEGITSSEEFMKEIRNMTKEIVKNTSTDTTHSFGPVSLGPCPVCGSNVYEGAFNDYYCENKSCQFHVWKAKKGVNPFISPDAMKELLAKGTMSTTKGVFTLLKTPPFISFVRAPVPTANKDEVIAFLKAKGLSFEDKTAAGGAFWVAGGKGVQPIIQEIEIIFGITAQFAAAAKALKKQPGWYYTAAQFE